MCFDFTVMQRAWLALARREAAPLVAALRERPDAPKDAQWATFLRNHDELTLDQLSDEERQEVFRAFGPEERMQIFGRGLRRRMPGMFDGDLRRMKLAYSLMFSLPGTPVIFYGEEIGLGENLDVEGRMAVRTPHAVVEGRRLQPGRAGASDARRAVRARARQRRGPEARHRSRCCAGSNCSSNATGSARSWPGASTNRWTPGIPPSTRTAATPTAPRSWPCTTWATRRWRPRWSSTGWLAPC
ncbi:hypothetical protein ACFSTC_02380 [Nonomuraea ferruginea]